MKRVYRFLAHTMVRTDYFPFAPLFRAGYRLAIRLLVRSLVQKCGAQLTAIYLRRSLAMDAGYSGLSDIDLLLVLHDSVSSVQKREIVAHWDRLCRQFPFLDSHHEIFTVPELEAILRVEPLFVFRLEEGRQTWKRIYGSDIFFRFPLITGIPFVEGAWAELKLHWGFFRQAVADLGKGNPYEQKKQAYLLFKCIATFARAQLAAQGHCYFSRPEVLAALTGKNLLEPHPFVKSFVEWGSAKQFRGTQLMLTGPMLEAIDTYLRVATQQFYRAFRKALMTSRHCQLSEFPVAQRASLRYERDLVFCLSPLPLLNFARAILLNDLNKAAGESTFYLSPDGSDFADGRQGQPWRTLQHAAQRAVPGDRFFVAAGEYRGFSLSHARDVQFIADGAIITEPALGTADGISLVGVRGITVEGFTIRALPRRGIFCLPSASGEPCSDLVFKNNYLLGNGEGGIWLSGAEGVLFENNYAQGTRRGAGLHVRGTGRRVRFLRNHCRKNSGAGIQINGDRGEGGCGLFHEVEISQNVLEDNGTQSASAIDLTGVIDSRVCGNRITHYHRNGITLYRGDAGGPCLNNVVQDNLVVVGPYSPALAIKEGSAQSQVSGNVFIALNGKTDIFVVPKNEGPDSAYFHSNLSLSLNLRNPHSLERRTEVRGYFSNGTIEPAV